MISSVRRAMLLFVDALADPSRRARALAVFVLGYVVLWTAYAVIVKSSQDITPDMAETVVWSRELALGYPKHPPLLPWVAAAWFQIFPLADWAYFLLATVTCAVGIGLATLLARNWLDGPKLAAVPFLLALIPFYNFIGLKFDQNSILIPLWAATTFAFVRSLDRGAVSWAILAGLGAAAAMLSKYWSAFFLLALIIATLFDKRRNDYFRSPGPYVTTAVAILAFLPNAIWLVQHDFPPMHWVATRRLSADVADWLGSLSEYSFGTLGYAGAALAVYAFVVRPSRAALHEILLPNDALRRRAAFFFWLPMLVPIGVSVLTRTNLLSLWNVPALPLLPVVLMAPPAVKVTREAAAKIAAAAIVLPLAVLLASPVIAYVVLKKGVENDAAYAQLVMGETERAWREVTTRPLTLMAGPFGLISSAAFYGADRPQTYPDFSAYLAPDVTPARIAIEGIATVCPTPEKPEDMGCAARVQALVATMPRSVKSEVTVERHWLGFAGPPGRFVITVVPPAGR